MFIQTLRTTMVTVKTSTELVIFVLTTLVLAYVLFAIFPDGGIWIIAAFAVGAFTYGKVRGIERGEWGFRVWLAFAVTAFGLALIAIYVN